MKRKRKKSNKIRFKKGVYLLPNGYLSLVQDQEDFNERDKILFGFPKMCIDLQYNDDNVIRLSDASFLKIYLEGAEYLGKL